MWYSDLGAISIGEQSGGIDDGGLGRLKVALYQLLVRHCKRTYCPSIDHFALGLFVAGPLGQFGPEGIDRIRRRRKDRYIAADIVVPEEAWRSRTEKELKIYLADRVRQALQLCIGRIQKDGEEVDAQRFLRLVDKAIAKFLHTPIKKERQEIDVRRWLARAKAAVNRKHSPGRKGARNRER
jgi:hypothetical protein